MPQETVSGEYWIKHVWIIKFVASHHLAKGCLKQILFSEIRNSFNEVYFLIIQLYMDELLLRVAELFI